MNDTAFEITYDKTGVCNFCRQWESIEDARRSEATLLPWHVRQMKKDGRGKEYDVLLGLSGGVDSSYCLHLVKEQGLRPLCFSIDNGWNNPDADENIMRMVETLKVPFYRYTIDVQKFRELQQAFIDSGTPNVEIPTDHILMASTYEMAHQYGIKWVISGGNHAGEGIMPPSWGYQARDLVFIKDVYRTYTGKKLDGLPMLSLMKFNWYQWIRKIRIFNLLDYYEYRIEDAKRVLKERYGWKEYGEKHCESRFTQWFQNFYLRKIFNIDKRFAHYSSLINSGQMKRADALFKMRAPLSWTDMPFTIPDPFTKRSHYEFRNDEKRWNFFSSVIRGLRRR